MGLLNLLGKGGSEEGLAGELFNMEYRKNVFRTDDQRMAAFYFSDENLAEPKGCFGKKEEKEEGKGCFKSKMPTVETRPYFDDDKKGCFSKKSKHFLSDADYDALVQRIVEKEDFRAKAMEALQVDETEVAEADPIHFAGYIFDDAKFKLGDDFFVRSTGWKETWVFFSKTSLLAYQCVFYLDGNSKTETTFEYQYKDVTSVKVTESLDETIDREGRWTKKSCFFEVVVPGDTMSCAYTVTSEEQVNGVKAMKGMIRDKKNN